MFWVLKVSLEESMHCVVLFGAEFLLLEQCNQKISLTRQYIPEQTVKRILIDPEPVHSDFFNPFFPLFDIIFIPQRHRILLYPVPVHLMFYWRFQKLQCLILVDRVFQHCNLHCRETLPRKLRQTTLDDGNL